MNHIINIDDIEYAANPAPMPEKIKGKFGGVMGQVGQKLGSQKLGYNVTVCPPGKAVFPMHSHRVNEEMFFILEGQGELRIGEETHPVKKGDFIACLPGGKEKAHQLRNTGKEDLKYLAVSTKESPEIAEYPDSGKFGVMDGQGFRFLGRAKDSLEYWEGE